MRKLNPKEIKHLHRIVAKNHQVASDEPSLRKAFLWELGVLRPCCKYLERKGSTDAFTVRLLNHLEEQEKSCLEMFIRNFHDFFEEELPLDDRDFLASLLASSDQAGENKMTQSDGSNRPINTGEPASESQKIKKLNFFMALYSKFFMPFIREAMQAVPAVKWALAVGAVAAIFALISMPLLGLKPKAAFIGVAAMFGFMGIMVIFAKASKLNAELKQPAIVFTWFSLFLFMATLFLLFTSAFFSWPQTLTQLFTV